MSAAFHARQEAHAARQGRINAASSSRKAVAMMADELSSAGDELASLASGISSGGRSLHPSVAGSACSLACSEATIGAGDGTAYWDYQHRSATKADLGHNCRECRKPFRTIGEPLTERRGARVSMRYHAECFSGFADPRSQATSSHHVGTHAGSQYEAAPQRKTGKMRTGAHFDAGGDSRYHGGAGGKLAGYSAHGGGFGARSSKPTADSEAAADAPTPQRATAPGDLTETALAEHLARQSVG